MGTRKAMEDSMATASTDVYRPPTLQPGLGAPRCPRCAAPLSKDLIGVWMWMCQVMILNDVVQSEVYKWMPCLVIKLLKEASGWTIAPFLRDSLAMIGTAVGGTVSAFYGFNHVMPPIRQWITRPMWLQFAAGLPPVMLLSIGCAGLAGGALPAFAQLAISSYHATSAASHSAISRVTVQIEGGEELQRFTTNSDVRPPVTEKG